MSVSNTGVAIYIDSIDLIIEERVEKAKEIVTTVARMIQYFNERNETAVVLPHELAIVFGQGGLILQVGL